MSTESSYSMLDVPVALAIVLAEAQPLSPRAVPLSQAAGLLLAATVAANDPLPPFAASVKDGYAVVAADGPGRYRLIGEVTAGRVADFQVEPGTVAYITTGAPMPPGADAVVMVEETSRVAGQAAQVEIRRAVRPGADVRPIGADIRPGEVVLAAGAHLGAAEIGLLATVGVTSVPVYAPPRVAILSTGDELVEPDQRLGAGQIRDSNRAMLQAAVHAAGAVPIDLGIAADQEATLRAAIEQGLAAGDILLTSGGVSMGDLDLIKPLLERAGQVHFGRIRMKPGKPLTFATVEVAGQRKLVFGLPGNPVSSLVTFYLFVVPAIRRLAGWPDPHLRRVQAQLAQTLPLDPDRPEYHRATLQWDRTLNGGHGGYLAVSTGSQASSRLLSMRTANALLELPQADGELPTGATVSALLIGSV